MKIKPGPCIEKKCSWCCNPVKVDRFFSESKIPVNKEGEKIWQDNKEILIPKNDPDGAKLKTYKCINYDDLTGLCKGYENRPEICRKTSCVDKNSKESIDEQYSKVVNKKFISISNK